MFPGGGGSRERGGGGGGGGGGREDGHAAGPAEPGDIDAIVYCGGRRRRRVPTGGAVARSVGRSVLAKSSPS